MKNYIKPSLILVVLIVLGTFVFVGAQQNQNNFNGSSGTGSGTVSANNGSAGAIANYAAAGGSTTVGPDTLLTDSGTLLAYGGSAGISAKVLTMPGATSGTATITPPGVAGTITNPFAFSNVQQGPSGAVATPTYGFTTANHGMWYDSGNLGPAISCGSATLTCGIMSGGGAFSSFYLASNFAFGLSSSTSASSAGPDTRLSRSAAGVWSVDSGTTGNTQGRLKAAGYMSVGTTFTSNAGCTESALTGGATAGKFTVGTASACTIVITMGNAATAPNGWTCTAYDNTSVPTVAIRQTAQTTTSCSLLMTVAASDVIVFSAIGW